MPRITVYIPAYRHERFVGDAIRSVLDQTWADFELLVADDASTDGTLAEIRRHRDPRLRVIALPRNEGAAAVANRCIREARGAYLCPLSSDDLFRPDKLERQVAQLDARPDWLAVAAPPDFIDEAGRPLAGPHPYSDVYTRENRTREEWLRQYFFDDCDVAQSSLMIRKAAFDAAGLYHPLLHQLPDFDFLVRLLLRGGLGILPEPVSAFRVREHGQNLSAPTPEALGRAELEWSFVLRHYLDPRVLTRLPAIFGAAWPQPLTEAEARLTLAEIAAGIDRPTHQAFAARILLETDPAGLDPAAREAFHGRARALLARLNGYRSREAAEWRRQKAELRDQRDRLRTRLEAARSQAAALRDEREAQRRSLIWKLARPLQRLEAWLRGQRR